ncbi:hypothetical protein AVEN_70009-1 [Araneus ventricosus]|uniref:Pre-C2HC domain-containing protein n=1 Tax=Araneus ventricosus TaxID=182803 RepID=A0A4Y2TM62_ARAVE|nr:hypothetical protein AVEN_251682-1 [Araneus ventricosus]GBO01352.1 hypothetical protein AVEN_144726-1 [Araneus ventricosus]GBO01395.1 hypothetical protein AVEN_66018-1 [Araneus ventricosus]GBO01410.1 hypothetical protein AVEN_70009-1 [Araneus ventricosus]
MVESSQYANPIPTKTPTLSLSPTKLTPNNDFKLVSPKKAAKPQYEEAKTVIKTSNRFLHLMDVTEKDSLNDSPKISIPAINIKLTEDYNLTVQKISRNFPETIIKYDRGYIRISLFSLDEREKIFEFLYTSEKEYVLCDSRKYTCQNSN